MIMNCEFGNRRHESRPPKYKAEMLIISLHCGIALVPDKRMMDKECMQSFGQKS
jgi:hypothetical protein